MKKLVGHISQLKPNTNSTSMWIILFCLLFVAIILIYLSTIKTSLLWWSDLTINLSAGLIGSIVTVFFIDFMINKQRNTKLNAVNKLNHYGLLTYIRILMINIMKDFDYISKEDMYGLIDNAEEKFSDFTKDKENISKLCKLNHLNKKNIFFIKIVNKTLSEGWKYLSKNIQDFKPYPDPILVHKLNIEMSTFSGIVSAGEELFSFYFDKLPNKVSKEGMKEMLPGMTVLWKFVSEGLEDPSMSYKNYYLNSFNFLIYLSKRCLEGNILYDI